MGKGKDLGKIAYIFLMDLQILPVGRFLCVGIDHGRKVCKAGFQRFVIGHQLACDLCAIAVGRSFVNGKEVRDGLQILLHLQAVRTKGRKVILLGV